MSCQQLTFKSFMLSAAYIANYFLQILLCVDAQFDDILQVLLVYVLCTAFVYDPLNLIIYQNVVTKRKPKRQKICPFTHHLRMLPLI